MDRKLTEEEWKEQYQNAPSALILDLEGAGVAFEFKVKYLTFFETDPDDLIKNIIEYVAYDHQAEDYLYTYIEELGEIYANTASDMEITWIMSAVRELGLVIIQKLRELKAYNKDNELWYEFFARFGEEVVLKKSEWTD
jgi:hypothetical protein